MVDCVCSLCVRACNSCHPCISQSGHTTGWLSQSLMKTQQNNSQWERQGGSITGNFRVTQGSWSWGEEAVKEVPHTQTCFLSCKRHNMTVLWWNTSALVLILAFLNKSIKIMPSTVLNQPWTLQGQWWDRVVPGLLPIFQNYGWSEAQTWGWRGTLSGAEGSAMTIMLLSIKHSVVLVNSTVMDWYWPSMRWESSMLV